MHRGFRLQGNVVGSEEPGSEQGVSTQMKAMVSAVVEGARRPTGERPMYIRFFNDRPDIRSVIHCHAPNVGAFAITDGPNPLMRPFFPETSHEVGPVPVVPYGEPLTREAIAGLDNVMKERNDPMFGAPGTYDSLVELYF